MIGKAAARQAAQILWQAWCDSDVIDRLPEGVQPGTRADGYAIQSALIELAGRVPGGWKIAATSQAGQSHIGVDGPLAGRMLAERFHGSGDTVSLAGNRMRLAEVEFAFLIGRTLPQRDAPWQEDEVLGAVEALLPAIELPDSRFSIVDKAGAPQLIADNACAWRFAAGQPAPESWRDLDLASQTARADVGGRHVREGVGSNVLGDPRRALAWLANELSAHGFALEAGQVVTTGTCLAPLQIQPGDLLQVDFGELGRIELRFSE